LADIGTCGIPTELKLVSVGGMSVKLFCYMSKVPQCADASFVPIDVRHIHQVSRKNNRELGINSILSYKFGYYFQVLEGPKASINQQIVKIFADTRHQDINVLVDKEISSSLLPRSGMRVVPNLRHSRSFREIVEQNSAEFLTLSNSNKERLSHFFDLSYLGIDGLHDDEVFHESLMTLSSMPCINDIQVSPNLVRLTNTLIKSEKSFNALHQELPFKSERELVESLSMLRKLGLLQLRKRC